MKARTLEYYEWFDIKKFICDHLKIEDRHFCRYHEVIGGDYKNWWHVWIWLNENVNNDSYMPTFIQADDDCDNPESYFYKTITERFGEWALAIVPTLRELEKQLGPEIVIHYSW